MTSYDLHIFSLLLFCAVIPLSVVYIFSKKELFSTITNIGILGGIVLLSLTLYLRGIEVAHAPFQTLYEVYITIALSVAVSYFLINLSGMGRSDERIILLLYDIFSLLVLLSISVILLYAYINPDYGKELPPSLKSAWFVPHVVVYLFGYGSLIVAFCSSFAFLILERRARGNSKLINSLDDFTYRVINIGFPFLTAGLIFGAIWAYEAWASYWGWDSKEVWSLITWLAYLIYLHLRFVKGWRGRRSAILVILGTIAIFVTLLLFGYLPASMTSVHRY